MVNEDGTISKEDNSSDEYTNVANFLIDVGAIEVDSNGSITYIASEEASSSKSRSNKKIDYDALYQECINPTGKYYGVMSVEELNSLEGSCQ